MQQRRLAIVELQGVPNVPGLIGYTDPNAPKPAPGPGHWIAVTLAAFAGLAVLQRFIPGGKQ